MKKRVISLLLALVLAVSLLPTAAFAAETEPQGKGTAEEPYLIGTAAELEWFRNLVNGPTDTDNHRGACAKLTADITLTGEWTPISNKSAIASAYSGTFDGDKHTISGLSGSNGLFGFVNGATIKNLKVEGTISGASANVGGIVGKTQTGTKIENCAFTGSVSSTSTGNTAGVGGIVGKVNTGSLTITNCYNTANVTSSKNAGGILGYSGAAGTKIENCFNTGTISGTYASGGIVGSMTSSKSSISNCYWTQPDDGNGLGSGKINNDGKVDSIASVIDKLGDAFTTDTSGNVILAWEASGEEPAPKEFSVSLTPGSKTLQMDNSGEDDTTAFTAAYENADDTEIRGIVWRVSDTKDDTNASGFESAFVDAQFSENDDWALTVTAKKPGTAYVTATVSYQKDGEEEKTASATAAVTVMPCFTTVEFSGTVAMGQTVTAAVNAFGGEEYDAAGDPAFTYRWSWYDSSTPNDKHTVQEGRENTYTIAAPCEAGKYLYLEVLYNGSSAKKADGTALTAHQQIVSAVRAKLEPIAVDLKKNLNTAEPIRETGKLTLPDEWTLNGDTARIEWSLCTTRGVTNGRDWDYDSKTGKLLYDEASRTVTGLPEINEEVKLILLGKLVLKGDASGEAYFIYPEYTIWSAAKTQEWINDQQRPIKEALKDAEFGEEYLFRPDFDTDKNLLTMFRKKLDDDSIGVSIKAGSVERYNNLEGTAGIDEDGKITYFYIDNLDDVPASHGTVNFNLTFVLSKDGVSLEYPAKVVFGWDKDKVRAALREEICGQLTEQSLVAEGDSAETVTQDLTLPFNVDGKTWAQAAWTSSNTAVLTVRSGIGAEPAAGVIRPAEADTRVTLTARYAFTYDDSITLSETFDVVIKAKEPDSSYQRALNAVFGEGSLTDAASGEPLTAVNGVFTVRNDIQFPTTRDLGAYMMARFGKGFDGKYTPVVITSSDTAVIAEPDVANAARVAVYRPAVRQGEETVTLTVKILDRPSGSGRDYANLPVLAEKRFTVTVQPLTEAEITNELALMAEVKAHYWDGIKNGNDAAGDVTGDLAPFVEVYKQDGALVWVRDVREMKNSGIVPVAMDGWQDLEAWRLFRSSNPAAVTHENLLVTQQFEGKAVTVTSALSSETLGRYGELYRKDPAAYADYKACDGLYYQPVSAELVVRGRNTARMVKKMITVNGGTETRLVSEAVEEKVTVSFTLSGNGELWLGTRTLRDLDEGVTVFDVLRQLRDVLSFKHKGGYVQSITCGGKTLAELDEGKNSGWLYTVNGELPDVYMSAYGLKNGDSVRVYFTKDYTKEPGADRWKPVTPVTKTETVTNADGSTTKTETKPDGTVIETTTWRDGSTLTAETSPNGRVETVEKRADGTNVETVESASGEITASVSVPKSVGSTRVDIPVSKPSGSMVAVIVHPDGTEEIVRGSVVTETGVALRAEGDVRLKIIDNAKRFNDMANHWAKDAVEFASSRELFNGVGNDAFGPDRSMTRGMVSTVLARLAGADTAGGETWYAKGTVWAVENGISDGTAPEQPVTREQLAAMLYRYAGSPAVSGELGFDDADSISAWARDAVRWCVDNGILNGVGGNRMTPQDLARRGQVAAMLMRFLQATV